MMLDLHRLHALHVVVTTGSITDAAAELHCSPSAVSQQMRTLARSLGITLLEADGRGVRPTPAAVRLAEHAREILAHVAAAELEATAIARGTTGLLRIASFATAGAHLVPGAVAMTRDALPGPTVHVRTVERELAIAGMDRGEFDIAIIETHPRVLLDLPAGIVATTLLTDPFRVVAPKDHTIAGLETADLRALGGASWVDIRCEIGCCRQAVQHAFAALGIERTIGSQADEYWPAQGYVAAGLGLALIPDLALDVTHAEVVARPVVDGQAPTRDVVVLSSAHPSRSVTVMRESLREMADRRNPGLRTGDSFAAEGETDVPPTGFGVREPR